MGTTVISPGESEKKPKTNGSPAPGSRLKFEGIPENLGPVDPEDRGLSEVSGNHADHQLHRRPGGHPDHAGQCVGLNGVGRPRIVNSLGSEAGLHEATAPDDAEGVLAILEVAMVRLFGSKILHMFKPQSPKLTREG
jgi:hypothetical protein